MPSTPEPERRSPPAAAVRGGVVFDLPADRLPAFAAAVRRLTGRPLQLHWQPTGDEEPGRVLVRVESPPAILLDRARAIGQVHIEPSPDIPPASEFVGEIDSLALAPLNGAPGVATLPHVETRLRLGGGTDHEPARLWVLRDDALGQLTAYCRVTHQQLLARFSVAVSATAGVPCVILRALTTKGPPPVFVGPAVGYAPLLKLPNVFVPSGTRLMPGLRRDALRQALGVRPDRVLWLHPLGDGGFRPESLPESSFRPLAEWIDFRVPDASAHRPWAQSQRWGFEPFVEAPPKKAPARVVVPDVGPLTELPERPRFRSRAIGWLRKWRRAAQQAPELSTPEEPNIPVEEAVRTALNQGDRLHHARPEAVSPAAERCQQLEARLLQAMPGQAETPPERWAELAAAYDSAGKPGDAALCWLNALWAQSRPTPLWAWGWVRSEARAARPEVKVIDPAPWLTFAPSPGTTRAMAAWVVWASQQSPPPAALAERGPEIQARLESHEHWLPVRAAWLARSALARAGRGDVLGLARTRDRLSERLLAAGLSLELDTPSFLRFAGEGVRERFQEARRWLADRRELIHQWLARRPEDSWVRAEPADPTGPLRQVGLEPDVAHTRAYADLVLAWGLSRFAEHATAEEVRRQGSAGLPGGDPVHTALREGFEFRITQVREGKPPRGPLPAPLLARIHDLGGLPRYAVDKLREHSRVLEPTAHVGGYEDVVFRKGRPGSWADQIAGLPADRLSEEVIRILEAEAARRGRPHLAVSMTAALDRSTEWTDGTADPVFALVPAALGAAAGQPAVAARLIGRGLEAAARWDRAPVVRDLTGQFLRLADEARGWDVVEALTGPTVRALRQVGLQPYAERVLDHVAYRVHQNLPIERVRIERAGDWPAGLRVLLQAAGGWYAAGREESAHAVIVEASRDLFATETPAAQRTALALAYVTALAQAPVRVALGRLEELFQRLRGIHVTGSTNGYYALNPLRVVESAVRAVVSDEFALGPQVRSWLHADELAVRRRIRDELTDVLATQGL